MKWFQGSGRLWKEKGDVVSMESWSEMFSGIVGNPAMIPKEEDSLFVVK